MNVYFVVEGKRTETKVYPKWLKLLVPNLKKVKNSSDIQDNQYYLFSSNGYPDVLEDTINAIHDLNEIGRFDYLVVCLDCDDSTVNDRIEEVKNRIEQEGVSINAQLAIIVQNRCFETWFLGNSKVYKRNPTNIFLKYSEFYDVSINDPELMTKIEDFEQSVSIFHEKYLEKMLAERNIRYSKQHPYAVCEKSYIDELKLRVQNTTHLRTLKTFFDFCEKLNNEMAV